MQVRCASGTCVTHAVARVIYCSDDVVRGDFSWLDLVKVFADLLDSHAVKSAAKSFGLSIFCCGKKWDDLLNCVRLKLQVTGMAKKNYDGNRLTYQFWQLLTLQHNMSRLRGGIDDW